MICAQLALAVLVSGTAFGRRQGTKSVLQDEGGDNSTVHSALEITHVAFLAIGDNIHLSTPLNKYHVAANAYRPTIQRAMHSIRSAAHNEQRIAFHIVVDQYGADLLKTDDIPGLAVHTMPMIEVLDGVYGKQEGNFNSQLPPQFLGQCNRAFDVPGIGKGFTLEPEEARAYSQRLSILKLFAPCIFPLDVSALIWGACSLFFTFAV
jgi:hypothetical protein